MQHNFALFRSHIDLAHRYFGLLLQEGDFAIDATCGKGRDSLVLATYLQAYSHWGLIGLDIQESALSQTRNLLEAHLAPAALSHVHLFHQSHASFPALAYQKTIRLIVYNLGYLPGGDKSLTTQTATTLLSVEEALRLICPGGIISITCYPGHQEGAREEEALLHHLQPLDPSLWNVCHHRFFNKKLSPSLILIQKNRAEK